MFFPSRGETNKSYATTRLGTETIVGVPYGYTYSNMGDIMSITRSGDAYKSYTYDALGEMRSETQHSLNRRTNYVYDAFGNISSKTTVNTTTNANVSKVTYNYGKDSDAGWNYLLTSLTFTDYTNSNNNRTETIDYDEIGNPLSYRGATMSWFGRQLRTYSKNGISANFMYDADGLRSAKGVNGVKTTYQYVGDQLFYEKIGENKTLYYFYDSYGNLSQIYYTFGTGEDASTARYFVSTNAQGDVLALYNSNGVKVGAYDYDAWGNTRMFVVTQDANGNNVHTQIDPETQYLNHIVNVNPIRYRGYYYDSDLDLYYLQSRYYDSEIGRFLNSDNVTDSGAGVLGYNTYLYCANNPINSSDPSGHGLLKIIGDWICQSYKTLGKLISLPFRHIEARVGLGIGLGGSFDIKATDNIVGATLKYSSTTFTEYSSGEEIKYSKTGIETGFSFLNLIEVSDFCGVSHMLNDVNCTCEYGDLYGRWNCPANKPCDEVGTNYGLSGALYVGFGAEYSIGFDYDAMYKEKEQIWDEFYDFRDSIKLF